MPQWVVVTKGIHRGRLAYLMEPWMDDKTNRIYTRWATGHSSDAEGLRTRFATRISQGNLRTADAAELEAHFASYPDDAWQCLSHAEQDAIPPRQGMNWVKPDGGVVFRTWGGSIRYKGQWAVFDENGQEIAHAPDGKSAKALLQSLKATDSGRYYFNRVSND